MSFLRIGDTIINTNHITTIKISSDNYRINMLGNPTGFLSGNWLFGSGYLNTENSCILVSRDHYKEGFDIVTKWLLDNKLDK
jgi:hypothetical protein